MTYAVGYHRNPGSSEAPYGGVSCYEVGTGGIDSDGNPCETTAYLEEVDWNTYVNEDQYEGFGIAFVDSSGANFAPYAKVVFDPIRRGEIKFDLVKTGTPGGDLYLFSPTDKLLGNWLVGEYFKNNINNQIQFRLKCYTEV